jgi:hypothetical protein
MTRARTLHHQRFDIRIVLIAGNPWAEVSVRFVDACDDVASTQNRPRETQVKIVEKSTTRSRRSWPATIILAGVGQDSCRRARSETVVAARLNRKPFAPVPGTRTMRGWTSVREHVQRHKAVMTTARPTAGSGTVFTASPRITIAWSLDGPGALIVRWRRDRPGTALATCVRCRGSGPGSLAP